MAWLFDSGIFSVEGLGGEILPGTTIGWYVTGLSTPQATYNDPALAVPNANPVVADAYGRLPTIWLQELPYKMVVTLPDGTPITRDPIRNPAIGALADIVDLENAKANRSLDNLTAVNAVLTEDSLTYPVGNELETYSRMSLTTNDARVGKREFSFSFCATYSLDTTNADPADEGKVLHYWGVKARLAVGKVWTLNPLLVLDSSLTALKYANVCEFDINNFSGVNYGGTNGLAGLAQPSVYGVTISGATTSALGITAGMGVLGHGSPAIFNRGFMVGPDGAVQAAFDDYSSATASYRDSGAHSLGLDLSGASYSAGWVYVPNSASLLCKTSTNVPSRLLNLNSSNVLLIGDPSNHNYVDVERTFRPSADNVWQCGESGRRFSSFWGVNGAIQTSDATLKTNIEDIDPDKASIFVDVLGGKSWTWIVGGRVPIYGTERQPVEVRREKHPITLQTKLGTRQIEAEIPIYEDQDVQVITGYEDIPGKRTHFGVLACDVKAAADAAGFEDFGGYVKGEDGVEAIRPDQIMAVMLVEIKSLRARVAQLEAA